MYQLITVFQPLKKKGLDAELCSGFHCGYCVCFSGDTDTALHVHTLKLIVKVVIRVHL